VEELLVKETVTEAANQWPITAKVDGVPMPEQKWLMVDREAVHRQWHTALVPDCQSPRLSEMHLAFHDQASRYRQLMFERTQDLDDFRNSPQRRANADEVCP
jgi:hypothetical protein